MALENMWAPFVPHDLDTKNVLIFLRQFAPVDQVFLNKSLSPFYDIIQPDNFEDQSIMRLIDRANVAVGTRLTPAMIDASRYLTVLQSPNTGVDNIDLRFLKKNNIQLGITHSSAPYVAEHCVGMMLSLIKKVALHDRLMRNGIHFHPRDFEQDQLLMSDSLIGKTVGFLGYGHIAREIVARMSGFGVDVIATTRQARIPKASVCSSASLDELLGKSDLLVVSIPLTGSTRNLLNATKIETMKHGAYLINISRAEIVDTDAVIHALRNGHLGGAGFDVWPENNFANQDHSLQQLIEFDNVILSPHRAGTHREFSPCLIGVAENLISYARTGELVSQADLSTGY